jgi:multisubunit Na+/H+ antiporter MnhG subunit
MNALKTIFKIIALLICVLVSCVSIAGFYEKDYSTAIFMLMLGAVPAFFIIRSFYKKPQKILTAEERNIENKN